MRYTLLTPMVALAAVVTPGHAATVDLQPYVNANVSAYSGGSGYPAPGTTTIGGISFQLAAFGGGTGILQLTGNDTRNIIVGQTGVNTAYVIINSAYGRAGEFIGFLSFNNLTASTGTNLVEGVNIRDHYDFGGYNTVSTNIFATANYGTGAHFDVYRYNISALGGTLGSVFFEADNAGDPQGAPFLAGITATFEGATPAVPEPAIWTMMIGGFGLVGGSLRARRRRVAFA